MKVLVADDSPTNLMIVQKYIETAGYTVIPVEDGLQAVKTFKEVDPDLVLLDVMMPNMDGFEAATRIRAFCEKKGKWIPIIFLTAMNQDEDLVKGIECGGDDYLTKPISRIVLNAKLKAMERIANMRQELEYANLRLKQLSEIDGLTGIANRRRFDDYFEREFRRAIRENSDLSLLLIDIDNFKAFNDYYGHQAGDDCLQNIATEIASTLKRPGDLLARYGGEEFAGVLPRTPLEGAQFLADELVRAAENLQIPHAKSTTSDFVTISIGYATVAADEFGDLNSARLIERADKALYQAKAHGRNRTECWSDAHAY